MRYNIGQCEEGLGRIGAALADYELAERQAAGDPKSADVAMLAQSRASALRSRVPRLTLALPGPAPEGLAVTIDNAPIAPASVGVALPVDPGHHTIDATAPRRAPLHREIDIKERGAIRVVIDVGPAVPGGDEANATPDPGSSRRTAGFVVAGLGGAAAITSVIFVVLHNGAVSDLRSALAQDCGPTGACARNDPTNGSHATLRDSAVRDETFSIVFAASAFAAIGTGAYLLLTPRAAPVAKGAWLSPSAPGAPAGLSLKATF